MATHATNPHQGSRSEYLATYAFTALGTVVPVPHQEDTGIDHYCTLTKSVGKVSTPTHYYSMQVKSFSRSSGLKWKFPTKTDVEWLINYPSPIFLCVVDKSNNQIMLYSILPRFEMWSRNSIPDKLTICLHNKPKTMHPGQLNGTKSELNIDSPILSFPISKISDKNWIESTKVILGTWINFENENLRRKSNNVRSYSFPIMLETNKRPNLATAQTSKKHPIEQVREEAKLLQRDALDLVNQLLLWHDDMDAEATLLLAGLSMLNPKDILNGDDGAFCGVMMALFDKYGLSTDGTTVGQAMFKIGYEMCEKARTYLKDRQEDEVRNAPQREESRKKAFEELRAIFKKKSG